MVQESILEHLGFMLELIKKDWIFDLKKSMRSLMKLQKETLIGKLSMMRRVSLMEYFKWDWKLLLMWQVFLEINFSTKKTLKPLKKCINIFWRLLMKMYCLLLPCSKEKISISIM